MTFRECQCGKPECHCCGPLVAIERMLREEFEQTAQHARIPTPEIVWWRAQMRAREDATRAAARPIVFTQALAVAAVVGLLISLAGRLTLPAFSWASATLPADFPLLPIALAAACWLVLAPLAVYFAFARE
jgi:hypothetical protein